MPRLSPGSVLCIEQPDAVIPRIATLGGGSCAVRAEIQTSALETSDRKFWRLQAALEHHAFYVRRLDMFAISEQSDDASMNCIRFNAM